MEILLTAFKVLSKLDILELFEGYVKVIYRFNYVEL